MAVSGTLQGYKERVFEATTGKIRNKPISKKLKKVLDAAAEAAGVEVRVTSGGQAAKGTPGPRTGSTRHDLGMAADLQLVKDGRVLDFTKAADRAVFETFTSVAAANGATGIGAGVGYMGPNTIHVGFGSKSVWGPGNSSANAPGWLKTAVTNGWNGAVSVASATADLAGFDGAPGIQGSIGNRTIKPGMKGEDVRALQSMLKSMGANIPVDGDYGPLTRAAIEKFQAANGLKVDGVIGARTRPMLELATAPNNPSVSLEARDEAYQARMLANAPKLQGTAVSQTSAIPEISGTLAPVSYHSAPKRVLTATTGFGIGPTPAGAAINRNNRTPLDYANEAALKAAEGIDYRAELARRAAPTTTATANSPFAEPSFTNRGLPPGAQAGPQQVADAKRKLGLELQQNAPSIGGVPTRDPTAAELDFFRSRPEVAGYAAPDNKVVLNPYSKLSPEQKASVAINEAARIQMRVAGQASPPATPEQQARLAGYGSPADINDTVVARALSYDPSAGPITMDQYGRAKEVAAAMNYDMGDRSQQPAIPTPRANPLGSAPQRTTIGNPAGIDMAARRRIDPRIMQDAMETAAARQALATQADNAAPPHIGPTPANALASRQAAPIAPRMVRTESIPQNVPTVSGATARPAAPDPQAMQRTFDIMSNYQPSAAPKTDLSAIFDKVQAPSLPSRTVSTPQVAAIAGAPMKTTDIPASMQAGYPKAPPALTQAQAANAARYAGLAAQYAQPPAAPTPTPVYQATSPIASAPIPRPNPLAAPQVMGATAAPVQQPPSAFQKLAPGMISMAMAGGPMGILGGFARLAAASLGNVNNPRGLGYDAGVAARNAAVARGVLASDLVGNGASYGRRQSDGTVTGTTSRGTGYTSSNGGDKLSVGGRSYTKNKGAGYSLDL